MPGWRDASILETDSGFGCEVNGRFCDRVKPGMLRSEWEARGKARCGESSDRAPGVQD